MKKALMAAICCMALISTARADQYWRDSTTLATSKYWSAIKSPPSGENSASCDLITTGSNGGLEIGTFATDPSLNILFFKMSWQVPIGTKTSVSIEFDGGQRWDGNPGNAESESNAQGHGLQMVLTTENDITQFFKELLSSNQMTVTFRGNEPPWSVNLAGLNEVSQVFFHCIDQIMPKAPDNGPAEPFHNLPQEGPSSPAPRAPQPFDAPSQTSAGGSPV